MTPDTSPDKWVVTLTVMLGTLMAALDTSIVNVAMPHMRGSLNASVEEITWVATGYMLSSVCIMPIIAFLSSRFGRKRFLIFCVGLFTVTSMLCGLAWDLSSMVLFRALQGMGGGALIPISQAILRETFPPEEHGIAMGVWGMGVVMGPAFGPTLGGWLTDNYSWPWIFYINIPVGVLNLLLIGRYIHDPPYLARGKGRIDFSGLLLMVTSLSALQIVLEKGGQEDWFESSMIVYLTALSATAFVAFVWRELTTRTPVVDLRILKDATFSIGTLIAGILNVGLYGSLFLLPMFLQQTLGYPAIDAGLVLMPRSLAMAVSMPLAGRIYNRFGARPLAAAGLLFAVSSFWQLSRLSLSVGASNLLLPQILQGFGFGMISVALNTVSLSQIAPASLTAAAGLYNVIRTVLGSFGIALSATLYTHGITGYRSLLVENVTRYREVARTMESMLTGAMTNHGADGVTAHDMALRLLDATVMRQASMLSFNHVHVVLMILFVLCMPLILLLRTARNGRSAAVELPAK